MFDGSRGHHSWSERELIIVKKNILKSGKKPVATNLYGNDAYMIHFQSDLWLLSVIAYEKWRFDDYSYLCKGF
jgi:hypothetical protein